MCFYLCLFFVSSCRCLDCLLDSGANPTLKNSKGYSAVHYAAALGNKQHLELVSDQSLVLFLIKKQSTHQNVKYIFCLTFAALGDLIQLPRGG